MTNTEKPTGITEQKKQDNVGKIPKTKEKFREEKKSVPETKEEVKKEEKDSEGKPQVSSAKKVERKQEQKKPKIKKTEASVNSFSLPISTKKSVGISKFIKNKRIDQAILDLEEVLKFKKAVPMKGEIPHRKGKGIMSGSFPKKATEHFIKLLKSLAANANANELENPIISEVITNMASRPYGRFGATRKKRSHVKIIARDKKENKPKKGGKKQDNGRKKHS